MRQLSEFPDAQLRIFQRPDLPDSDSIERVYLVGICGTGMGSLAGLFKEAGFVVTGSDAAVYPPMSERLAALDIPVIEGYRESNLSPVPDLTIVGNACTPTHVEAAMARDRGFVQASFPEALAHYFIKGKKSLVVAGTHGKTTTTSLLVHLFHTAGLDPGFLVGGVMNDGDKSYATGSNPYFIVEGDEYDSAYYDKRPKFLHYEPSSAIITSVEFDHADIYRNEEEYLEAFEEFAKLIPDEGLLAIHAGDPHADRLRQQSSARVQLYGIENGDISAIPVHSSEAGQSFVLRQDHVEVTEMEFSMSGQHNLQNALAAIAIALDEGLPISDIRNGLKSFQGVQRRQQIVGTSNNVTVIDDFAHHPTAVGATIQSICERYANRRVVAIFEPRSNSSRRKIFESGYATALGYADAVFLSSPPFRHNDDPDNFMSLDVVSRSLTKRGIHTVIGESADELLDPVMAYLEPGDIALVMSNGGFGNIHRRILKNLEAH